VVTRRPNRSVRSLSGRGHFKLVDKGLDALLIIVLRFIQHPGDLGISFVWDIRYITLRVGSRNAFAVVCVLSDVCPITNI
jgi:hypothetical protein